MKPRIKGTKIAEIIEVEKGTFSLISDYPLVTMENIMISLTLNLIRQTERVRVLSQFQRTQVVSPHTGQPMKVVEKEGDNGKL